MKTVSKKLLSILLVAILLVSAIPFQAFAEDSHNASTEWSSGPVNHWHQCSNADCTEANGKVDKAAHTFVEVSGSAVAPTCVNPGKQADQKCSICNYVKTGEAINPTGAHTYGPDGKCTTTGCTATCPHTTKTTTEAGYAATCGANGKTDSTKCTVCNMAFPGETIPATGAHSFGDNGVCTVCGASDPNAHVSGHTLSGFVNTDPNTHWQECTVSTCTAATLHTRFNEVGHNFTDASGNPVDTCACGYKCPHSFTLDMTTYVAPDCIHPGKEADQICSICKIVHIEGAEIPATGAHTYNANGECTVCGAKKPENELTLTLDANGGKVNGGNTMGVTVKKNYPISVMPDPIREGFNFVGWFLVDQGGNMTDTRLYVGQNYPYDTGVTVKAKWADKTQVLTVRRVLNGDNSTAKTIYTANVPEGTPLLDYLKANVAALVNAEVTLTPGYSWQNNYWRDYSGTQPLTGQADTMNQAQTVYVNFVSNEYRLYFNANGGTVTRTSQAVKFGEKVGELPTPYKEGSVFTGWKDANGNVYTPSTIYKVAGDTSLTAVWQDEALVILYIYINGDFSTCNRMIVMDGYVKNNNISRSDVFAEVSKYYTPASGTLKIAGLFDENTWGSYRLNTGKAGTENIQVGGGHLNKVFVMVSNANTGSTVLPTTPTTPSTTVPANGFWVRDLNGNLTWYPAGSQLPAGTGYWVLDANGNPNIWVMTSGSIIPTYIYVGTNPKTGDTAKIEIAAAIMVLAAAALVTVMALRKKKSV